MIRTALIAASLAMPAHATPPVPYDEPARGTWLRADLLEAVRPKAEERLGAPVVFVVSELRHRGDIAFAVLEPQRPNGIAIDWADTAFAKEGAAPDMFDGLRIDALLRLTDGTWQVDNWAIGATDLWYSGPETCADFAAVLPDICR